MLLYVLLTNAISVARPSFSLATAGRCQASTREGQFRLSHPWSIHDSRAAVSLACYQADTNWCRWNGAGVLERAYATPGSQESRGRSSSIYLPVLRRGVR